MRDGRHADPGCLALVISGLRMGGAERVLTILANAWHARGRRVTVVALGTERGDAHFPLADGVEFVGLRSLGASHGPVDGLRRNFGRITELRRVFGRIAPSSIVSFMDQTNVLTVLASRGLPAGVVVSERIDPDRQPLPSAWNALRAVTYPYADAIVVQTEAVRGRLGERWGAPVRVIPNPVEPPAVPLARPEPTADEGRIVAAGRLDRQKGFDLLLEAFSRLAVRHDGWQLVIWGEGPERPNLEAQMVRLGLQGRASLPGAFRDRAAAYGAGDLFVLPSRWEGYPNTLCEAMAWGLPVVAADCASGPAEIVTPGVDGALVAPEDPAALAVTIDRLIANPALRRSFGARAHGIVERLGVDTILDRWEETLARAARHARIRAV